jgi:hypothetical protein
MEMNLNIMQTKAQLKDAKKLWESLFFDTPNFPGLGECCSGKYGPKCNGLQDHTAAWERLFQAESRISVEIYKLQMKLNTLEQKENQNFNINKFQQRMKEVIIDME